MIVLFIGVYIVLAVFVYLMFNMLKKSVNKLDDESKNYYVDKLQEYDDIINDKEEKLNNLNEEIKNKKVELESIKLDYGKEQVDFDINIIDVLSGTKYHDASLFEIEKIIREKFNYNNEKIIEEFVNKITTVKNYEFCKNFKRKFNSKIIYDLKLMSDSELDEYLNNTLEYKEYELLETYKSTHTRFVLNEFLVFLDELVELNNPNIVVYVGDKKVSYDHLSKYVDTKYDESIYKGIKIKYQSKMYDFSLNGKEL